MAMNTGQMNSHVATIATLNGRNNDETAGPSSVNQYVQLSSRKRVNPATTTPKGTSMKRRKLNSTANSPTIEKSKSINDLPSKILESILQMVSTADLIKCRRLNRKFNEIASQIMRQRADIELRFSFSDGNFMRKIQTRHCPELLVNICDSYLVFSSKSLTDLIVCLKESTHFPITSFQFDDLDKFGNEDMKTFLSVWGKEILALNIHLNDPMNTIGILRDLLVDKAPNLKILELKFKWEQFPSSIKLFADSCEFELPKLQALCVNNKYRQFRGIIENILKAACNLNDFSCSVGKQYQMQGACVEEGINADDLAMLQSFNKIHCLKNLRMDLSADLISFWDNSTNAIDLKVETLAISVQQSIFSNNQLNSSATAILSQLFHSSKDVIQTLKMGPLGSLPGLNVPKFKNLQKLDLFGFPNREPNVILFPPLLQMADNFPKLKDLGVHINWRTVSVFPKSQPIKPMPSIEVLRIIGYVSAECQDNLMKATPNVTTLLIEDWSHGPISINFQSIGIYLPKLQSFGWLINRITHHELLHSLDAAITGLPVEFCKQNAKKFRKRVRLSAKERGLYLLEPRNSSILDLKELKRMDVNFLMDGDAYADIEYMGECGCENSDCDEDCERFAEKDDEAGFGPDNIFYKTGFTKVSKLLAFDLMPHLKVRTHKFLD